MNVIQGQKPCYRFRPLFDSYISNELLVETTHEILRHIEECSECSFLLEERSKARDLLRRSLHGVQAGAGLRSRIQKSLSQPAAIVTPKSNARYLQIAAGLAIALFSGLLYQMLVRDPGHLAALLDLGWNQHARCTLAGHFTAQPPAREKMVNDLGPAYESLMPVVETQLPDYRIRKAHICRVQGRQFAHFILQKDSVIVSVSLIKKQNGEDLPRGILRATNASLHNAVRDQGEIVAFETPSHLVYVMGNGSAGDLAVVARRIEPAARSIN